MLVIRFSISVANCAYVRTLMCDLGHVPGDYGPADCSVHLWRMVFYSCFLACSDAGFVGARDGFGEA